MRIIEKVRELDFMSKIALINLVTILSYFLFVFILAPFFIADDRVLPLLWFHDTHYLSLNIVAALLGIIFGSTLGIVMGWKPHLDIKKVLSADENRILKILQETPEITQDSLKFRLGWSRPKLSAILTNMERMNLVQRKREGKTFTVFLAKHR